LKIQAPVISSATDNLSDGRVSPSMPNRLLAGRRIINALSWVISEP
jgi:hypothetical protein